MSSKAQASYVSEVIKQEIARYESVHPRIYSIYDIMERLTNTNEDQLNQMREHILAIEDSFVNGIEFTLSRVIPDIRLGVLGSAKSGKSALVHRFLTGTYVQEESPEGGRFKKEMCLDGQSYLLMIRDEEGAPDTQFSLWVDVVILVFSLEDDTSFQCIQDYYRTLKSERQALLGHNPATGGDSILTAEVPIILVGTQDAISEYRPRVIDEAKARRLALQMNRSSFFETCAMYGLNVDRVFMEACKHMSQRASLPVATSVQSTYVVGDMGSVQSSNPTSSFLRPAPPSLAHSAVSHSSVAVLPPPKPTVSDNIVPSSSRPTTPRQVSQSSSLNLPQQGSSLGSRRSLSSVNATSTTHPTSSNVHIAPNSSSKSQRFSSKNQNQLPQTPNATPNNSKHGNKVSSNHRQRRTNSVLTSTTGMSELSFATCAAVAPDATPHSHEDISPASAPLHLNSPRTPPLLRSTAVATNHNAIEYSSLSHHFGGRSAKRQGSSGGLGRFLLPFVGDPILHNSSSAKKSSEQEATSDTVSSDPIGSGRSIPLKMGYLEKRSSNSRRKKKFVIISEEGVLTYYSNMKDFQENSPGKSIDLSPTTVKIPGVGYSAGVKSTSIYANHMTDTPTNTGTEESMKSGSVNIPGSGTHKRSRSHAKSSLLGFASNPGGMLFSSNGSAGTATSFSSAHSDNGENCEFHIVSLSNRHWRFWAECNAERDAWVAVIKEAIENALQRRPTKHHSSSQARSSISYHTDTTGNNVNAPGCRFSINTPQPHNNCSETNSHEDSQQCLYANTNFLLNISNTPGVSGGGDVPSFLKPLTHSTADLVSMLRDVPGNTCCADCGAEDPQWASVNLGIVLCIHCAGVHRELGTHLSRVRSMKLDAWPQLHVNVMLAIGNTMANSVWEAASGGCQKPGGGHDTAINGSSTVDAVRARYIREKYVEKVYLAPPPYTHAEGQQQLIDAIARGDIRQVILMLAINQKMEFVNKFYSPQDQRLAIHIAATLGHLVDLQLLAWAFADMSAHDGEGRNAYFYAVASGKMDCAEFLLHWGCTPQHMQHTVPAVKSNTHHIQPGTQSGTKALPASKAPVQQHSNGSNPSTSSSSLSSNPSQAANSRHWVSSGATLPRPRIHHLAGNHNNNGHGTATPTAGTSNPTTVLHEMGI